MVYDGIIRNLDNLGRVVIPKELRNKLDIKEGERVTITDHNNVICIRKYRKGCIFCGSEIGIIEYRDICVCKKCRKSLNK